MGKINYNINFGKFSSVFAVPSSVVDEHIALVGALQLKVLLLLLRNSSAPLSSTKMAEILHQSESNIADALGYWLSCGIVLCEDSNCEATTPPAHATETAEELVKIKELYSEDGRKTVIITEPKKLSRGECLDIAKSDKELARLLKKAQEMMGAKTMTSSDIQSLTAMHSYYGLACDYIVLLMAYCKSLGKMSTHYVEKTAANWLDDGIDTYEKAEMHIKKLSERSTNEGKIKMAFGISDRGLTQSERKLATTWFDEFAYDTDIIRLAYERCVGSIGKLSFPYINKILRSWYEAGVKTTKQAAEEASKKRPVPSGQMVESSYNINELDEKLISDFIKNI